MNEIQCVNCRNLISGLFGTCHAFPEGEGIPGEIVYGHFDHRLPWPNSETPKDRGVRWEPAKKGDTHVMARHK